MLYYRLTLPKLMLLHVDMLYLFYYIFYIVYMNINMHYSTHHYIDRLRGLTVSTIIQTLFSYSLLCSTFRILVIGKK